MRSRRRGHGLLVWFAAGALGGCVPGVQHEGGPIDGISGASAPPGDAGPFTPSSGPPNFGSPRNAERPARPLIGGTLLALPDGRTAVAADPDRDRIYVADYATQTVLADIELQPGDEPGRLTDDDQGRVHVALRAGGALVTLAPDPWRVVARRPVCTAPRGVAFDPRTHLVHVACAEGELVSLPGDPAAPIARRLSLADDLRDVVVDGDALLISRHRSAEVLTVAASGNVLGRTTPASRTTTRLVRKFNRGSESVSAEPGTLRAGVAARLVPFRAGQALMLHQRALADEIPVDQPGGYGGNCGGIVEETVSAVGALGSPGSAPLGGMVVGLDLAVSPDGQRMAVIAPGNRLVPSRTGQLGLFSTEAALASDGGCGPVSPPPVGPPVVEPPPPPDPGTPVDEVPAPVAARAPSGQATAVAWNRRGHLLVQTREPASIQVLTANRQVLLSRDSRADVGQDIFYTASSAGLACASCHPEGGDDGRIWKFADAKGQVEERRTQNLRGGILGTAPFHWNGDLKDLGALMDEVFVRRMNGPQLGANYVEVLGKWIETLPALPRLPARDPAAVERGRVLFASPAAACVTCHNGPLLTNNTTVDVGTGRALQVPSLRGLAWRAPYMHDGCAPTLGARFALACGGGDHHGVTSRLTSAEVADLAAFLQTL
jgi:cytochrome c553